MLGLSITAIGLRPTAECMAIFEALRSALKLDYLELAIGSPCPVNFDYPAPLILHDSCLYKDNLRLRLKPLHQRTWQPYAEFIANHHVRAVSLHPPLKRDCSLQELEAALYKLQQVLQVPVYVEIMPSEEYWCSSINTLVEHPLLIDVSHMLIWYQGDRYLTQQTCYSLLQSKQVGEIHLSHNNGYADAHDLIPADIWFNRLIEPWSADYFITFESLPSQYAEYERLDKKRRV